MDPNTVLLLDYIHGKSSRLAKATKPQSWDQVDVPELIRQLKERKKIKEYPLKNQFRNIIGSADIKPITYSRNNKLRNGVLVSEDDNIYQSNSNDSDSLAPEEQRNITSTKLMYTPSESGRRTPMVAGTPESTCGESERTPISLGHIPVTPKLASLDCTAGSSQMATLRLPLIRELAGSGGIRSPKSIPLIPLSSRLSQQLKGGAHDCRLSCILPDRRLRSELAVQTLLLASGFVMFPDVLESRLQKPNPRLPLCQKLALPPGCPSQPVVPDIENDTVLTAIDAARKTILLSGARLKAFAQVLSFFVDPKTVTEPVTRGGNQPRRFVIDGSRVYSSGAASSLSSCLLMLCDILGKLGGETTVVKSRLLGEDPAIQAAYTRAKQQTKAAMVRGFCDGSFGGTSSSLSEGSCDDGSKGMIDPSISFSSEDPPRTTSKQPWTQLIGQVSGTDTSGDELKANWAEYKEGVTSLLIRQAALLTASLGEIKLLAACPQPILTLINSCFDSLFSRFLRLVDSGLFQDIPGSKANADMSSVTAILSPSRADLHPSSPQLNIARLPSECIQNKVLHSSALPTTKNQQQKTAQTEEDISFHIKNDVKIPELRSSLGDFLEEAATLVHLLDVSGQLDGLAVPGTSMEHLSLPPHATIDILFATFALLRDSEGYVQDLGGVASTFSQLFAAAFGLEQGFGELLVAAVAASSFNAEWLRVEHKERELLERRVGNWGRDLAISANYSILAWHHFRHTPTEMSSIPLSKQIVSSRLDLIPEMDDGLEFRGSATVPLVVLRKAIAKRILECTEPFLQDVRATLPNGEAVLDVLLQTFVVCKMMILGKFKMARLGTDDRRLLDVTSPQTPRSLQALREDPNCRSLSEELVPQCFPKEIVECLAKIIETTTTARVEGHLARIRNLAHAQSLIPIDIVFSHLPNKHREKASTDSGKLMVLTDAGMRPAESALPPGVLKVAQRDAILDFLKDAIKEVEADVKEQTEVVMPRFSRFFVPLPDERLFVPGTDLVISPFAVHVRAVANCVNALFDEITAWDSDVQLGQIKAVGSLVANLSSCLRSCLKSAHVFGIRLLEVFDPVAAAELDETNTDLEENTPQQQAMRTPQPAQQDWKKKHSEVSKTLVTIFPNAGKYLATATSRRGVENIILSDADDLEFAVNHPRLSVIRMSRALGVRFPPEQCEKLMTVFLAESRQRMRDTMKRLSTNDAPKVMTVINLQRPVQSPDEVEDVMGTLTKFKNNLDIRYGCSSVLDYVALLNTMLEEITGTQSGLLPSGWGSSKNISLSASGCVAVASFFSTLFSALLTNISKAANAKSVPCPCLSPLMLLKKEEFSIGRLETGSEPPSAKEQFVHKMHKLKVRMKGIKTGRRETDRAEAEKIASGMSQEDINRIARTFGLTLPPFSPRPSFDKLPPRADDLLPFPERIKDKSDILSLSPSLPVQTEAVLMKKLVGSFLRLNSIQALEWEILRFKGTLEELTEKMAALEVDIRLVTKGLDKELKQTAGKDKWWCCLPEEQGYNEDEDIVELDPIEGGKTIRKTRGRTTGKKNNKKKQFNDNHSNMVTSMFITTRDLLGKLRGEIISGLTSHFVFVDLKPLFQVLYYENTNECTFDTDLKFTLLHTLQLMARSVYPGLINTIARSLLFDVSVAMAGVILDTGYRSRVYDTRTYEIMRRDFCTLKSMFAGDGNGPVPESFIQSNMLPYAHAVKYNHPQYIAKFQQIVVKDSEMGSFFKKTKGPIGLSSTSQYIRVVNGYRYTNDEIRTGMQIIKRKALSVAFPLVGITPSSAKRK